MSVSLPTQGAKNSAAVAPEDGSHRAPAPSREPTGAEPPIAVQLKAVSKSFGSVVAVRDVSLVLREGTLTSLLGPSGCGKTTLLRLIAGLENASSGEIEIKGRSVGGLPIHKRNIGLVFQNYALFPHKTIGDNIAFGLKHRGVDRELAAKKVERALDMVRLPGIQARYPNQLSGGQQQRVALARAVVFKPDVLLLDEPLSALDANLREEMRTEIKLIQKALGVTTILVTHDQQEALAMSDEIVVMNEGTVQQIGNPQMVYRFPRNRFVAGFLGQANVCSCDVVRQGTEHPDHWLLRLENGVHMMGVLGRHHRELPVSAGVKRDVMIRGTDMTVSAVSSDTHFAAQNGFSGVVVDSSFLGDDAHYLIDANGLKFKACSRIARSETGGPTEMVRAGTQVFVSIPPEACAVLPAH